MKILQINVTLNTGSTGRISEQIGETSLKEGFESHIAFSRAGLKSSSQTLKIGNKIDFYKHVIYTRLFDRHGFASKNSTRILIKEIEKIQPEIIHLHNIHGYYLHIEVLFKYLSSLNIPIIWTFHDCWPFTGHCAHFEDIGCEKWKSNCYSCPKIRSYPKSLFLDNSKSNFLRKKEIFTTLQNLTIITPSRWLKNNVERSFFNKESIEVINNGIDLSIFKAEHRKRISLDIVEPEKNIILGVASIWTKHRGLLDFIELSETLDVNYKIILVGLSKGQIRKLPSNIIGIERTENIEALVDLYTAADVYVNPTYSDTFPTTNIEALACGTPVITYNTGGSPEAIDNKTGLVFEKGDIKGVLKGIETILNSKDSFTQELCRKRAEDLFNKNDRFKDYIDLYKTLLVNNGE